MARMFVTLEIMPDDPGTSLETLKEEAKELIEEKEGKVLDKRTEFKPIAFGLKALVMTFSVDETKGTDEFEEALSSLEGVSSVKVTSMSRAMG